MSVARLLACIVAALLAAEADAQSRYSYLHKAADEIHAIQRKTLRPSASDAAMVAAGACNTLTVLLDKDPAFRKDIEMLASASTKNLEFHRQLADDLVFFIDTFVPQEHEFLLRSGVSAGTTADILVAAALSRESLRKPLSAQELIANMEKLRMETCKGARVLADAQESENSKKDRRRLITKWSLGIGGLSLIAADVVFAAPTGGVATASFTLGGAGVGAAVAP